jgi:hypothetical protein
MDCYDAKWCPDGDCAVCDYAINQTTGRRFVWAKVRQFLVRVGRRDFGAGRVAYQPPVYATHEDALREVMRTGRAAVFEEDERGGYRKTWEDGTVSDGKGDDRG